MKKMFRLIAFFLLAFLMIGAIVYFVPDQYEQSYQRALQRQYDYFKKLPGEKVIFVGSSSLSYGLDIDYMEELTGKKCVILGNHYQHGLTYVLEMSKKNLKKGDTVVIEYSSQQANACGADLILSGIGKRYEMYRFFYPKLMDSFAEEFMPSFRKNFDYWISGGYEPDEIDYSIDAYDWRGNMVLEREESLLPSIYPTQAEYPKVNFIDGDFCISLAMNDDNFIDYINEYVEYCKKRNVSVLVTIPPFCKDAVTSDENEANVFDQEMSKKLNCPYVSHIWDYVYEMEYMYNAVAHCNTEGTRVRTNQLYHDILAYI